MKVFANRKKNKQLGLTYAVFLMNGMLALSIGSLLPFVRDARGLDYGLCGLIVSLHSVGNLFSSFLAFRSNSVYRERITTLVIFPSPTWEELKPMPKR